MIVSMILTEEVNLALSNKVNVREWVRITKYKPELIRKLETEAYEKREEKEGETGFEIKWTKNIPSVIKNYMKKSKNKDVQK